MDEGDLIIIIRRDLNPMFRMMIMGFVSVTNHGESGIRRLRIKPSRVMPLFTRSLVNLSPESEIFFYLFNFSFLPSESFTP